jgi:uncharacterized membrane protein
MGGNKLKKDEHHHDHELHVSKLTFGRRLRNYFLTGLMIAGPVGITLYIAWWIIGSIDNLVKPLIPAQYDPNNYLPFDVPGFGLVVAVVAIMTLGFLTANLVGRSLLQFGESILARLPMVSTLYGGLKQLFETVMTQSNKTFKQVGIIQYPRPGIWAIVLISTEAKGEVAAKIDGDELMGCFLPTTPNPTSGFLLFVPKKDITILDMGTEDAAKLIISAGLVAPEYQAKTAQLAKKVGASKTVAKSKKPAAKKLVKRTVAKKPATKKPSVKKKPKA